MCALSSAGGEGASHSCRLEEGLSEGAEVVHGNWTRGKYAKEESSKINPPLMLFLSFSFVFSYQQHCSPPLENLRLLKVVHLSNLSRVGLGRRTVGY